MTGIRIEAFADELTAKLIGLLKKNMVRGPRTFGFEQEFLSMEPLTLDDMNRLYAFLPFCGFLPNGAYFESSSGMSIAFEPGGQIEYCSPPIYPDETAKFDGLLRIIDDTNRAIRNKLGIDYAALDYIPGRASTPLCLESDRYVNLHARMPSAGTRGHEMMMGTASIHLHASIRSIEEILPLFTKMLNLSHREAFRMSYQRRNIWENTDSTRCGLPGPISDGPRNYVQLIKEFVVFALNAVDIEQKVPFNKKSNPTFDSFLNHMTTIFTDVRLNLKGPTWELRTLDSLPAEAFRSKWKMFIDFLRDT